MHITTVSSWKTALSDLDITRPASAPSQQDAWTRRSTTEEKVPPKHWRSASRFSTLFRKVTYAGGPRVPFFFSRGMNRPVRSM